VKAFVRAIDGERIRLSSDSHVYDFRRGQFVSAKGRLGFLRVESTSSTQNEVTFSSPVLTCIPALAVGDELEVTAPSPDEVVALFRAVDNLAAQDMALSGYQTPHGGLAQAMEGLREYLGYLLVQERLSPK
jgi:hypothetical protein